MPTSTITMAAHKSRPKPTGGTPDKVLTTYVDPQKRRFIVTRGERLEWSPSKFNAALIDWWIGQGAPPIHFLEQKLAPLTFEEFKKFESAPPSEVNTPPLWPTRPKRSQSGGDGAQTGQRGGA